MLHDEAELVFDDQSVAADGTVTLSTGKFSFETTDACRAFCEAGAYATVVVTTASGAGTNAAVEVHESLNDSSYTIMQKYDIHTHAASGLAVGVVMADDAIGIPLSTSKYLKLGVRTVGDVTNIKVNGWLGPDKGLGSDDKSGDAAPNPVIATGGGITR